MAPIPVESTPRVLIMLDHILVTATLVTKATAISVEVP